MEEPSIPKPASNDSSVSCSIGYDTWCQSPGMSVKRRSRTLALCFLANSRTVLASGISSFEGGVRRLSERRRKNAVGRQSFAVPNRHKTLAGERPATNDDLARRLLQSVALCRTDETKAGCRDWQFDCSYSRDKAELILELVPNWFSRSRLQPARSSAAKVLGLFPCGTRLQSHAWIALQLLLELSAFRETWQ